MQMQNQINKTYSTSFAEYIYNSIQSNAIFFLTSDWGFFVNIENNNNPNSRITNQNTKNNKIRNLATIKENSVKSFQSMSNLHDYDYDYDYEYEYNEIVFLNQDKKNDKDNNFCILNGQIIFNTISVIKNNLYLLGMFALNNIGFSFTYFNN